MRSMIIAMLTRGFYSIIGKSSKEVFYNCTKCESPLKELLLLFFLSI